MFENKTLKRLDQMVSEAISGTFQERDYDETQLSRLEAKWMHFLSSSKLSKESLEKEKENVKSLVSDISHQTRTPMTNVKLYTSLLEENLKDQPYLENKEQIFKMTEEIWKQTEKMEFLIQSLMKISRLENNIVEVKPKPQKLISLLEEAIKGAAAKAEGKGISIVNTYHGEGYCIYDKKWTMEAIANILDNGIKYAPPGSDITISVTEYEMYAAICVKDRGIGISQEDLPKIFGRFYRAEEVQQEEGVGIGLYLAREILKNENGYIKVKSRLGEGSEFMLYLPRILA